MLRSVTLENFKSFGAKQTIPLQPITVLVGPNNSGKSNFISVARLARNAALNPRQAVEAEGGVEFLVRRPPVGDGSVTIEWESDGRFKALLKRDPRGRLRQYDSFGQTLEPLSGLQSAAAERDKVVLSMTTSRVVKLTLPALQADCEVVAEPELEADGRGLAAIVSHWRGFEPHKAAALDEHVRACVPEVESGATAVAPGHPLLLRNRSRSDA